MSKRAVKEKAVFIGRDYYMGLLDRNICLVGEKGIGKTSILKEYVSRVKDRTPVYVDFESISLSPEEFCVEFIGNICYWILGGRYSDYLEIGYLEKIKAKLGKGAETVEKVKNELEKISPDQKMLLELAFNFPEVITGEKEKIVLCMDEFWRILDLNNFSQISDVISLFKSLSSAYSSTNYIITGSAIELSKGIAKKLGLKFEEVKGFDKRDVKELVGKDVDEIYRLSDGIPYVVSVLAEKEGELDKVFAREMFSDKGVLHNFFENLLIEGLGRARGKTLLWVVLKKLCVKEMKLSEISRAIYRSSAVTKNLLSRLMDVDLIVKEGNLYSFRNKILKNYVERKVYGVEEGI